MKVVTCPFGVDYFLRDSGLIYSEGILLLPYLQSALLGPVARRRFWRVARKRKADYIPLSGFLFCFVWCFEWQTDPVQDHSKREIRSGDGI